MCDFLVAWITYCFVRDPPMAGSLFLTNCECSHLKLGSTIRFPNISCIFSLRLRILEEFTYCCGFEGKVLFF